MHSQPRLAWLQNERQRGKGTGCHNLASHSGQEQQLQTHRSQARAPTPASAHMDARSSGRKQAVYNQTPSCSLMHGGRAAAAAVPRRIELAEGRWKKKGFCRDFACPAQVSPMWVKKPLKSDYSTAVVWILASAD